MPKISALGKRRQEGQEFKASPGYIVSLRPVSVNPVSKKKRKKEGSRKNRLHLNASRTPNYFWKAAVLTTIPPTLLTTFVSTTLVMVSSL